MKVSNKFFSGQSFGNYEIKRETLDYLPVKDMQFMKDTVDLCEPFLEKATDGMDLIIYVKDTRNDSLSIQMKKDDKNFAMSFPTEAIKRFQECGIWFPKFLKTYVEKFQKVADNSEMGDDLGIHMELMKKYPEVIEDCLKTSDGE